MTAKQIPRYPPGQLGAELISPRRNSLDVQAPLPTLTSCSVGLRDAPDEVARKSPVLDLARRIYSKNSDFLKSMRAREDANQRLRIEPPVRKKLGG